MSPPANCCIWPKDEGVSNIPASQGGSHARPAFNTWTDRLAASANMEIGGLSDFLDAYAAVMTIFMDKVAGFLITGWITAMHSKLLKGRLAYSLRNSARVGSSPKSSRNSLVA